MRRNQRKNWSHELYTITKCAFAKWMWNVFLRLCLKHTRKKLITQHHHQTVKPLTSNVCQKFTDLIVLDKKGHSGSICIIIVVVVAFLITTSKPTLHLHYFNVIRYVNDEIHSLLFTFHFADIIPLYALAIFLCSFYGTKQGEFHSKMHQSTEHWKIFCKTL